MCATACPTGALAFNSVEEMERKRRCIVVHDWPVVGQSIRTKAWFVFPQQDDSRFNTPSFDVADVLQGTDEDTYYDKAGGAR